jgi:hypothetical protein
MCEHQSPEECIDEMVQAGHLEIDPDGRIFRVKLWITAPGRTLRAVSIPRRRGEHLNTSGYFFILRRDRPHSSHAASSRLIWYRAHGPIPPGFQVNHCNCVKTDNRLAKLELVTPSQQAIHRVHVLRHHWSLKLTELEVREIRRRLSAGERQSVLARAFGVAHPTIHHIATLTGWRHVT